MISYCNLDGNDEEIFGLIAIIGLKEIFGLMAMITDDGGNIAVTQVLASVLRAGENSCNTVLDTVLHSVFHSVLQSGFERAKGQ